METIIQQLVKISARYPKYKAVADAQGWYSYERLNTSDVLARDIIERADKKGVCLPERIIDGENGLRIAVIMPRVKEYLVCCIGVLKAGCSIVPIDPTYPTERITNILEDVGCSGIVTCQSVLGELRSREDGDFLQALGFDDSNISVMEDILEQSPADAQVALFDLSVLDNEGLVIYTSGSTGKPKGVIQSQNIFVDEGYRIAGEVLPGQRWACMASFTFLASLTDLFCPLLFGGSAYIIN